MRPPTGLNVLSAQMFKIINFQLMDIIESNYCWESVNNRGTKEKSIQRPISLSSYLEGID